MFFFMVAELNRAPGSFGLSSGNQDLNFVCGGLLLGHVSS